MASKRNKERNIPPSSISWLQQLVDEVNVPFPPEGQGWYTMSEICEQTERDHQIIRKILKDKNAESRKFKFARTDGKIIVTTYYRMPQG